MTIREKLERHPRLVAAFTAAAIAVAIGIVVYEQRGEGATNQTTAYYTVDEGATLFTDDVNKQPPFDHNGKPALLAMVYSCDGGKTRFVQCLKKLGSSAKAPPGASAGTSTTWLVKKPGSDKWIEIGTPGAAAIFVPTCPAGGSLDQVLP